MNKNDYINEVEKLHAPDGLRDRISQSAFDKPKKSVNRKKRIISVIAACLAVAVIAAGAFAANPLSQTKQENNIEVGYDGADESISDSANGSGGTELYASDSSAHSTVSSDSRKIIKHASVNIETKNSGELIKKIDEKVKSANGYVSSLEENNYNDYKRISTTVNVPPEKLDEFLEFLEKSGKTFDVVFTDPPRAGCSKKFLNSLCNSGVKKVVYISCNPETLARDLRFLIKNGYSVDKLIPFDMFPQTSHIESIVRLSKKH